MASEPARQGRFHALRHMASLKAAREFGLSPEATLAIAMRFDARSTDHAQLVDALADALIENGVVALPRTA